MRASLFTGAADRIEVEPDPYPVLVGPRPMLLMTVWSQEGKVTVRLRIDEAKRLALMLLSDGETGGNGV